MLLRNVTPDWIIWYCEFYTLQCDSNSYILIGTLLSFLISQDINHAFFVLTVKPLNTLGLFV
jgi:hypothetical protein